MGTNINWTIKTTPSSQHALRPTCSGQVLNGGRCDKLTFKTNQHTRATQRESSSCLCMFLKAPWNTCAHLSFGKGRAHGPHAQWIESGCSSLEHGQASRPTLARKDTVQNEDCCALRRSACDFSLDIADLGVRQGQHRPAPILSCLACLSWPSVPG